MIFILLYVIEIVYEKYYHPMKLKLLTLELEFNVFGDTIFKIGLYIYEEAFTVCRLFTET